MTGGRARRTNGVSHPSLETQSMKNVERLAWRRRHWLALCLSTLVTACGGGGSGDGAWDTAAAWDDMTWQ